MRQLLIVAVAASLGCAGVVPPAAVEVRGRIVTIRRPENKVFEYQGRTYVDRSLRVDARGGLADAAVYLEGRETPPWVSGKAVMNFGEDQFEPRVAFVSPGEPVEIGDTRDDARHELVVNLKGLVEDNNTDRVFMQASRPTRSGKPERVGFQCRDGTWKACGNLRPAKGRTKELTFDQPVLVPLDWD
jgi:hypothetical protein